MDHSVIRKDGNHTASHAHAQSELLVAHKTMTLVRYRNVPVAAALSARCAIANMQLSRYRYTFRLSQRRHDA
jgi:hypothetical protein